MNTRRLLLLVSSVLLVPSALVVSADPAAAVPSGTTFGSHVSSCAVGTGFTGRHNPSHHRGPAAHDHADGMRC